MGSGSFAGGGEILRLARQASRVFGVGRLFEQMLDELTRRAAPVQVDRVADEAHDGRRHERARSQHAARGGGARPDCNARSG